MKGLAIAFALIGASLTTPALAADDASTTVALAAATVAPNRYIWEDSTSPQPISVVVSIADQRAYVYRGEALIAVSSVSTGKEGKATPAGVYPILQKKQDHKSNLYNAAPMPFMQRLTWDGIALHAGRNPGFPASHGCVRLPAAFAKKLFEVTSLGTTVTVMDESFDPAAGWTPPVVPVPDAETEETERANSLQLASLGN